MTKRVKVDTKSGQMAEVQALVLALQLFPQELLNVYTDSQYVAQIDCPLETAAYIAPLSKIHESLLQLQGLLWLHDSPVFIGHFRAHTPLSRPLSEGNRLADKYTRPTATVLVSQTFTNAQSLHQRFHLDTRSLCFHTGITKDQAIQIVKDCPVCVEFLPVPHLEVNPKGLTPNHIWQMDVTHVPSFGKLQFIHVSVDTFSHLIFASAHSGEKAKDVKSHCLQAFTYIGVPRQCKTDNGPAYTGAGFAHFCQDFDITLKTGIPYDPQGQAVLKWAHLTLKSYLTKKRQGDLGSYLCSPHSTLSLLLYTLNFLTVDTYGCSVADCHWQYMQKRPLVKWKDFSTGLWKGPDPVTVWARGSVCIFPQDGENPIWIPERYVRHITADMPQLARGILGIPQELSDTDAGGNS